MLCLCLSGKGSAYTSGVSPKGKGLRLIYICAEPEMGADGSALLWDGIPGFGVGMGREK